MNDIRCFTSVNNCYLPKARVLAKSVKSNHPDWKFDLILSDIPNDDFSLENEPFDSLMLLKDLGIANWKQWAFKHRIVELCTAVKGPGSSQLLNKYNPEKLIYLDPDTAVFNSMAPLIAMLDDFPIVLTPHQTVPENDLNAIIDNEVCSMKHGIFNLGFFAIKNEEQGREFIEWWKNRLNCLCYDDIKEGLFVDQKWCDHAPVFFDRLNILRDPGYNVATWNLTHRKVTMSDDGELQVNGYPLRFYHFSGYDSGAGAIMLSKYSQAGDVVNDLWDWYQRQLSLNGHSATKKEPWAFGVFENGEPINDEMRLLYRQRADLQNYFPDPFSTSKDGGYCSWWHANAQNS